MFISILVLAEFIMRRKKHPEFRLFSGALRLPAWSGMVWPISFQSFQLSIHWVIVPVPPRHLSASECWVSDELSGCISDGNLYCIDRFNNISSWFWSNIFITHARILKVLPEGIQLWLCLIGGERIQTHTTISGPSSARQRNAIEMAFSWRAEDGLAMNAGSVALWICGQSRPVLLRNSLFLWFFQGWTTSPPPFGSTHEQIKHISCDTATKR